MEKYVATIFKGYVFGLVFVLSIFAIFHISGFSLPKIQGNLNAILNPYERNQDDTIYFQLALFFVTGTLSLILMAVNFFLYQSQNFTVRVMENVDKEIKTLKK